MRARTDGLTNDLDAFAGAVAHELRTPLAAVSGEVDLALRRERTAAAYREALERIAVSVAELVELTGDLALFGHLARASETAGRTARVEKMIAHVAGRYYAPASEVLVADCAVGDVAVNGDEALLTRALTLVLEHAVRHRRSAARVRLRAEPPLAGPGAKAESVALVVDAAPGGFSPHAWQFLIEAAAAEDARRPIAGPLRLQAAERIIRDCGGSIDVRNLDGSHAVWIRLQCGEAMT